MKKKLLYILIAALIVIGGARAMEFRQDETELVFSAGGSDIAFEPSLYTGLKLASSNFYLHLPVWRNGERENDLRLGQKADKIRVLAENEVSRTVEAWYPLKSINESKALYADTTYRAHLIFRQYRDIPAITVSAFIENLEKDDSFEVQPFLIGRNIPENSDVTSVRWSPPPATVITEKLEVKPQMSSHPHYMVSGGGQSFGFIGQCGKEYTGATLNLVFQRTTVSPGRAVFLFTHTFVLNPGSYERLVQYGEAIEVLETLAFTQGTVSCFEQETKAASQQTALAFYLRNETLRAELSAYDDAMDKRVMRFRAANDPVFNDDCLELSILMNKQAGEYCHFMVNPLGTPGTFSSAQDDSIRQLWTVKVGDRNDSWKAVFEFPLSLADRKLAAEEQYLLFHANREAKYHGENSGYPTGKFHSPKHFGRLLLTDYGTYLTRQIEICRTLGADISTPGAGISVFEQALLDLRLQRLRKELSFKQAMIQARSMIDTFEELPEEDRAKLADLVTGQEETARKLGEIEAYTAVKSSWMKALSGGMDIVLWRKPPFDYISSTDLPVHAGDFSEPITMDAAQGEYECDSVVVTNLSDVQQKVTSVVVENPGNLEVVFRYGYPMMSTSGFEVNDPLLLMADDTLEIPAHSTREIWVTVSTGQASPGDYPIILEISGKRIEYNVKIYPVKLEIPENFASPFFSFFAGPHIASSPEWVQAFKDDMRTHHAVTVTVSCFPIPNFTEDGRNLTDYSLIADSFRYVWDTSRNSKVIIYWSHTNIISEYLTLFENRFHAKRNTETFARRFRIWLEDWYRNIRKEGFDNEIYMYPVDEDACDDAYLLIRMLHRAMPECKVFLTVTDTATPERLAEIMPDIDVISPHYFTWRNNAKLSASIRKNKLAIWPYFNIHPCSYKDEGYSVYRRMGWRSFQYGATGFGTWIYFQPYCHQWKNPDMAMVYIKHELTDRAWEYAPEKVLPEDRVIPSKRWEGWREGAEDYFLLRSLEAAIAACQDDDMRQRAQKVLEDAVSQVCQSTDASYAGEHKRKILQTLQNLKTVLTKNND